MFDWVRNASRYTLVPAEEREALLETLHPIFRKVDAAFHAYLEEVIADPARGNEVIEQALIRRGVSEGLAGECVVFGPLAWGRVIVERLEIQASPLFLLSSLIDSSETELPLAHELVYAWARALIGLYHTPERNEVMKVVGTRSAEVDAINNALNGGVPMEQLRGSHISPVKIPLRRVFRGNST